MAEGLCGTRRQVVETGDEEKTPGDIDVICKQLHVLSSAALHPSIPRPKHPAYEGVLAAHTSVQSCTSRNEMIPMDPMTTYARFSKVSVPVQTSQPLIPTDWSSSGRLKKPSNGRGEALRHVVIGRRHFLARVPSSDLHVRDLPPWFQAINAGLIWTRVFRNLASC